MTVPGGDAGVTWQDGVLGGIGAPVNAHNRTALSAWAASVGMADWAYNWLGSTYPVAGAVNINGSGVKAYPHYQAGIDATVAALHLPLNSRIIAELRATAAYGVLQGVINGSGWPRTPGDRRYPDALSDLAFGEVRQLLEPSAGAAAAELYDWSDYVRLGGDTFNASASRALSTSGAIRGLAR